MLRSVLTVVALCVTIVLFFVANWWLKRKALTYTVSVTRLLTVHETVNNRVQILFDGTPARDVCLVEIILNNSGHEPIRTNDFERPLRFHCGYEAQILTLDVVETKPMDLRPVVALVSEDGRPTSEFELQPLLLNRRDSLKVKALVNEMGTVAVHGRVVGVREIRLGRTNPRRRWLQLALILAIGIGLSILSNIIYFSLWGSENPIPHIMIAQDKTAVEPGGQVLLSMDLESRLPAGTVIRWSANEGHFSADNGLATRYYAPNEPKENPVVVTVDVGNDRLHIERRILIHVISPPPVKGIKGKQQP